MKYMEVFKFCLIVSLKNLEEYSVRFFLFFIFVLYIMLILCICYYYKIRYVYDIIRYYVDKI